MFSCLNKISGCDCGGAKVIAKEMTMTTLMIQNNDPNSKGKQLVLAGSKDK